MLPATRTNLLRSRESQKPVKMSELGDRLNALEGSMIEEESLLIRKLGETIKNDRLKLGLSQVEIAGKAGISRPYLSDLERGLRVPSVSILVRLARVMSTSASVWLRKVEKRI